MIPLFKIRKLIITYKKDSDLKKVEFNIKFVKKSPKNIDLSLFQSDRPLYIFTNGRQ